MSYCMYLADNHKRFNISTIFLQSLNYIIHFCKSKCSGAFSIPVYVRCILSTKLYTTLWKTYHKTVKNQTTFSMNRDTWMFWWKWTSFFQKKIHKKETKLIFFMGGGGVTSSGVQKVLLFQTSRLGVNSTHWLFAARWRMIGHAWLASCPQRGPFLASVSARLHSLVFWFLPSVLRNFCRIFLFDLEGRCVEAICHRDWILC